MRDRDKQDGFFAFPLGFAPLPPDFFLHFATPRFDTDAYAAFGDVTWRITDRFRLIGGLRWSRDHLLVVHSDDVGLLSPRVSLVTICPTERDNLTWDSVTYRAGAQYELGAHGQVYATVSDGFKSGGVNTSGCKNTFNPETITSYEIGYKGRLFDGRLTLDAAAFWYEYADFQLAQVVGIAAAITNAASAKEKGLEVEAHWTPDEHWTLDAGVALLDARFGSFLNTDGLNPQLGAQNLKGRILPDAPQVSGNLGVAYRTSMMRFGR
jgi:iron complex outermembrane receptor protein